VFADEEIEDQIAEARRFAAAPEARLSGRNYRVVCRKPIVKRCSAEAPCRLFNKLTSGISDAAATRKPNFVQGESDCSKLDRETRVNLFRKEQGGVICNSFA
jgi:hypothetical protein